MTLEEFISNKEVEFTKNLIAIDNIEGFEKKVDVSFGGELVKYIVKYGYLAYKHIELYGINSRQQEDSDMIKQTIYLHRYFPETREYVAIENCGDGKYALVSTDDIVFFYNSEENILENTGLKLFSYILKRFQEIDVT